MNKRYFNYLLRSSRNLQVFLLIIDFIFPTLCYFSQYAATVWLDGEGMLLLTAFIAVFEAFLVPIYHLHFINKKSGNDRYLALPLKRRELYFTTLIFSILEIFIIYCLTLAPIVLVNLGNLKTLDLWVIPYCLLVAGLIISVTVLISTAVFLKSYSTFDGIVTLALYLIIPSLLNASFSLLIESTTFGVAYLSRFAHFLFYPFLCGDLLEPLLGRQPVNLTAAFAFMIFLGVSCFLSVYFDAQKRKAENAEAISDNFYSYPLVIALLTINLILMIIFTQPEFSLTLVLLALVFVAYLTMNFIYRRKIKLQLSDIAFFLAGIFAAYLLLKAAMLTGCFGIEDAYLAGDKVTDFNFNYHLYDTQHDQSFDVYVDSFCLGNDQCKLKRNALEVAKKLQSKCYLLAESYEELEDKQESEKKRGIDYDLYLAIDYGNLRFNLPVYPKEERLHYIAEGFYDLTSEEGIAEFLNDVYTMVENGLQLHGRLERDGKEIHFQDYEAFAQALTEFLDQ